MTEEISINDAVLVGFEVLAEIASEFGVDDETRISAASALINWQPPQLDNGSVWVPERRPSADKPASEQPKTEEPS